MESVVDRVNRCIASSDRLDRIRPNYHPNFHRPQDTGELLELVGFQRHRDAVVHKQQYSSASGLLPISFWKDKFLLAESLVASLRMIGDCPDVQEKAVWAAIHPDRIVIKADWEMRADLDLRELTEGFGQSIERAVRDFRRQRTQIALARQRTGDFVAQARKLEADGYSESALDLIYETIDEMLRSGRFAWCDAMLNEVDVDECSLDVLLALLTATSPAASKLSTRASFYSRVKVSLQERGVLEPGLLDGLEG